MWGTGVDNHGTIPFFYNSMNKMKSYTTMENQDLYQGKILLDLLI